MKKITSLLLALVMCFALCACGGGESSVAGTPAQESVVDKTEDNKDKSMSVSIGQEISTDFVNIALENAEISYVIGGKGFSSTAPDGMRLFGIKCKLENTGSGPLSVANINAEMLFNGEYSYIARATISDSKSFPVSVAALMNAEYWIYAEIPEALIDKMDTCEVKFAFEDNFEAVPESFKKADHSYIIELDSSVCKSAVEASSAIREYFKESPALPTPIGFTPANQTSSSSSSTNGKVTSIRYGFTPVFGRNDDVKDILDAYVAKLSKAGYEVSGSGKYDVSLSGVKLATVSVDGKMLSFDIVPGNENLAPSAADAPAVPVVEAAPEVSYKIGDTLQTDYVELKLEKVGSAMEIRSGTGTYGSYRYYSSETGDPYFYVYGTMKNIGGAPMDIGNMYIQFCFDEKYNYKGDSDGVNEGYERFIDDLAPLSTAGVYIYTAVPQELIDSYDSCVVKIGFTEDSAIRVVGSNDLPKFENCDDVFNVLVER